MSVFLNSLSRYLTFLINSNFSFLVYIIDILQKLMYYFGITLHNEIMKAWSNKSLEIGSLCDKLRSGRRTKWEM